MSKIKIQGSASGNGTLTIQAPTTSTDRTLNIPDSSGTLLDENSSVPAANLTGTVADARISALTASKLTGALPAISGAALTNIDGGKVLQFKSAIFRGQVTTMSSSWVAMPDNLSITPISATSKLFVQASSGGMFYRNAQFGFQIFRDGSQTAGTSDDFQLFVHNSNSDNNVASFKLSCVVTSGNTNATNFKVYGKGSGDYTRWADSSDVERLITIMEIEV